MVDDIQTGGEPNLQDKTVSYTPTESQQTATVTADSGYDGLDEVSITVGAIDSEYVGSDIPRNTSSNLLTEGATVIAPSGYYENSATKTVQMGTAGTPTASKGTVSNHSVSVTPSVTNQAGYIYSETKTGTAVSVSASELVSGTKSISANGTEDVTNYASVSVSVPNSYSASDEGKVVNNGALVAQTSDTVTANDTYDTTLINSLTVNVSGGGGISVDDIATRNITGNLTITANSISTYAFYGCKGLNVSAPNATTIGQNAFMETGSDSTFDFPNVTTVGSNAFNNMYGNLYLPKCTTLSFPFQRTGGIGKYLALPKLTTAIATDGLRTSYATIVDLGYTPSIGTRGLYQGNGKTVIILRKTDAVVTLTSGALNVANTCKVYVPSALKASYQTATNWTSYSQITFENLEGSIYESETWPED